MQYSLLVAGALSGLASLTMAQDPPFNVCRAIDGGGNVFNAAKYGPVVCAIRYGEEHAGESVGFPATGDNCHPIFCNAGVGIDLCPSNGSKPQILWGDVRKTVEDAFVACGGVPRSGSDLADVEKKKAYHVAFQSFQYVDKDWSLTVRAQNCDDSSWTSVRDKFDKPCQ